MESYFLDTLWPVAGVPKVTTLGTLLCTYPPLAWTLNHSYIDKLLLNEQVQNKLLLASFSRICA